MTVLLQVSDPHFGTERPAVVAALERLAAALRPDLLLMTGDITQRARRSQFDGARAFADRLRLPSELVIPGNHDIPLFNLAARLFTPYRSHRRAFGAELEPQFESPDVRVIGVNTTRRWRHTNGEVSAAQVARVAAVLRAARAAQPVQWRIVAVHQPVAVADPHDRADLLRGAEAAIRQWSAAGADAIAGGHIHLPFVLPLHHRSPDLAQPIWAVQAGTAVSHRVRDGVGNSVNVIRAEASAEAGAASGAGMAPARRCVVERWDHIAANDRFERVSVHRLDRSEPAPPSAPSANSDVG